MPEPSFNPLYPYPSFEAALHVLARDQLYRRIPPGKTEAIARDAWDWGGQVARLEATAPSGSQSLRESIAAHGIGIVSFERDCVAGGLRRFSEYDADANTISLYLGALAAWASANACAIEEAVDIALAHEFYHYLEIEKYGPTARRYTVPILRLAGFTLGRAGLGALSEIAAYGFSQTYILGFAKNSGISDSAHCITRY